MATGRYTRIDGRKSSGYCSTITIVLVVSACLIGAWMMMSSSVEPEGNVMLAAEQKKADSPQKVVDNPSSSREFEDGSGDLTQGTGKGNDDQENVKDESNNDVQENVKDESNNDVQENESASQKESENSGESSQEEKLEKPNTDDNEKHESDERKEVESEKEENGQQNTGEGDTSANDQEGSEGSTEESKLKPDESEGKSGLEESSNAIKQGGEQESTNEKETEENLKEKSADKQKSYSWKLCNVTAGPDYIPCLDNIEAIRKLPSRSHYEHRERHCPQEPPTCLVPLPEGYKTSVKWPKSRDKIWFANVPHTKLAEYKGHQNWVKASGEYLTFPGGGTQFIHGVTRYIDLVQKTVPDIAWGKRTRVVLDVGCGVASFGGYLFDKDVVTMSLAPKDEHEAQVQFALERGIPAISAVMGSKRLPFPGMAFDVVHCARCRVPWHNEGGKLLLELNRVLRPGGYFVWSATPVYRNDPENAGIWKEMSKLTKAMCWDLVEIGKDPVNEVSVAIYKKPMSNDCYEGRPENDPPLCQESDNRDAAWGIPLQACMHKVPTDPSQRGSQWPAQWPSRVQTPPYWLKDSEVGVHGKPAAKDFTDDYKHWKKVVTNSYLDGIGIDWSSVRNVMDMRATYGGFAAALRDLKIWVMNVVPVNSLDTLPIIYERGLFGIYHDWCESFSTYPRTYDLLHADHLFSNLKKRCNFVAVMAEVDRILRPEGRLVIRDNVETITEVENMAKTLHWKIRFTFLKDNEGLLCVQKTRWRPSEVETILSAIGII